MNNLIHSSNNFIHNSYGLLNNYVRPLLGSATLSGPHHGDIRQRLSVSFDTAHQIRIYPPHESQLYFTLKRNLPFSYEEKEFVARLVGRLHEYLELTAKLQTQLATDIIDGIVAGTHAAFSQIKKHAR